MCKLKGILNVEFGTSVEYNMRKRFDPFPAPTDSKPTHSIY